TYAYPAKTSQDTGKLDTVLDKLNASKDPIVVICPGGAGGATRSIDYLTSKGVDAKKLYILEKGQKGWKYDNLLEK
ncbi:MAG: rhodanese-like domain-containing protein, partial [Clostridium sp.]